MGCSASVEKTQEEELELACSASVEKKQEEQEEDIGPPGEPVDPEDPHALTQALWNNRPEGEVLALSWDFGFSYCAVLSSCESY